MFPVGCKSTVQSTATTKTSTSPSELLHLITENQETPEPSDDFVDLLPSNISSFFNGGLLLVAAFVLIMLLIVIWNICLCISTHNQLKNHMYQTVP
ncbi:envelope glycoprotein 350 [Equid gammaherpesvirus 2]|nr:envelope glycoprotein 350 [Equid gammaherpesvirus 2]